MDLDDFLVRSGGIARTRDLQRAGFARSEVARGVADGLVRPGRGLVALPQHRADVRGALQRSGLLTCASAARDHGLWIGNQARPLHLLCDHGRARGVVVHRGPVRSDHPYLPLADVRTVVVHALGCLDDLDAVAVTESAMRHHGISRSELEAELSAPKLGPHRRRLRLVTGAADSYPEVAARLLLLRQGIPFREQVQVPRIGRVDFLVCGVLILEVDGLAYHSGRDAKQRDDRRNNEAAAQGFATLRFLPEYFLFREDEVVAAVLGTLRRFGLVRVRVP